MNQEIRALLEKAREKTIHFEGQAFSLCVEEVIELDEILDKALALLKPCETCGGSKKVRPQIARGLTDYISDKIDCPACTDKPSQEPATIIAIHLIGTEGQLDKGEGEYAVCNIKDAAERAKQLILELGNKHKNYGWSIIMAQKPNSMEPACPTCGRYESDEGFEICSNPYHLQPKKNPCKHAKSDMTPCYLKDGENALATDGVCVGCGYSKEYLESQMRAEPESQEPALENHPLYGIAKELEGCCICYDVKMSEKPCCPPKCTPVVQAQKLWEIIRQEPAETGEYTREEFLKCYGWADGLYLGKCHTCKKEFTADKRAINCKPCAMDMAFTGVIMALEAAEKKSGAAWNIKMCRDLASATKRADEAEDTIERMKAID